MIPEPSARRPSVAVLTPHARYHGGVETVNAMLVAMLDQEGFETRVISQEAIGGGALVRLKKRLFGLNRLLARHFARHHSANTDVVICNGEFSFGVRHPAAVNTFHGCYFGYARALRPWIAERRYRGLMRLADQQKIGASGKYVVAVSRTLARVLEEQGVHVDMVIDNAIDVERFRPAPDIPKSQRCLFVGSSDYFGKGFDILGKLADAGVPIDCVTSVRPRDSRLGWLGNVPNEELPSYYTRYSVLLLPSRFEGCGIVALEAMACGTPIVMTSVGAGPDIAREIPEFVVGGPWETVAQKFADRLPTIRAAHAVFSVRAREYVVRHHGYQDWKKKWLDAIARVRRRAGRPPE